MDVCGFGCTGDDVAVHNGWFRCTPESRAMLVDERAKLAADELTAETERLGLYDDLYIRDKTESPAQSRRLT